VGKHVSDCDRRSRGPHEEIFAAHCFRGPSLYGGHMVHHTRRTLANSTTGSIARGFWSGQPVNSVIRPARDGLSEPQFTTPRPARDLLGMAMPILPMFLPLPRCASQRIEQSIGRCAKCTASAFARSKRSAPLRSRHNLTDYRRNLPMGITRQHQLDPSLVKAYARGLLRDQNAGEATWVQSRNLFPNWPTGRERPQRPALPAQQLFASASAA